MTLGLRTATFSTLTLDGCEVRDEDLLDAEGSGLSSVHRTIERALRVHAFAPWIGLLRVLLEKSVARARERIVSGKPVAASQSIRAVLCDMRIRNELCQRLLARAASLLDHGGEHESRDVAAASLFWGGAIAQSTQDALRFHGGRCSAGSGPGSYRATLCRTERGFRLRGEKSRISNACTADVAVVLARLESEAGPDLGYAVVDLGKPGITRREEPKLGLDGMSWGTLGFDDVDLATEDVILGASIEKTMLSVEWGQLLQAFCALGLAQASLDVGLRYAAERQAFGRPIAHLPVVYGRLADMHAEIQAARLLATEAAILKAEGRAAREVVMMAKIHATEMAVRVADQAMRTLGGWGYAKRHIVERLYRDSLANVPAGLPTDRLRELIACSMVGVDPWAYEAFDSGSWAG